MLNADGEQFKVTPGPLCSSQEQHFLLLGQANPIPT